VVGGKVVNIRRGKCGSLTVRYPGPCPRAAFAFTSTFTFQGPVAVPCRIYLLIAGIARAHETQLSARRLSGLNAAIDKEMCTFIWYANSITLLDQITASGDKQAYVAE
jgi:hypothetical protein